MNGLEHAVKWDYHHQEGHDIEAAVPAEGLERRAVREGYQDPKRRCRKCPSSADPNGM